ncbi:MAG TPA: hypothetical protein VG318_10775 [Actinomycetota bacterium]|nr:hypothetical protein [Actinomycetota bacterium]
MPSDAFNSWREQRSYNLDALVSAHASVGGTGPGRRWGTEQLNLALALRLAVEFQGFCRELHDLAAQTFGEWTSPSAPQVARTITWSMTTQRQIDRGNATEARLTADFDRFGLRLSPALRARDPRTTGRLRELEKVNRARNAIAHDNPQPLDQLRREGRPITLTTVKLWRGSLNGLATTLDAVVADHLATLFGKKKPW